LLPLVCLELQALLAELEPLLGVWEQVWEWEGEEEGEVWQRRGRAVFWGSLAKQEEGEVGVWLWEEEAVSLLWEVEEVFWMEEEGEVFWMEEEGEVFSWLGEVVVF